MYEDQYQREKVMREVFYEQQEKENKEVDDKRPALFRKHKAYNSQPDKNIHEEFKDMSSKESSFKDMKKQYNVSEKQNQVDYLNQQVFQAMFNALKDRQIKFYAFLNKEFNILNYKSARCSYYCFEDMSSSVMEASQCVHLCREGIIECKDYAENLQKQADQEIKDCQEKAMDIKKLSDPMMHWISCYEKLIGKFDDMEKELMSEFSNII
ncbi:unnamed protein product [Moneuplotes crassus]|uniref:Uncharacterized protein n=1 Tax=Euplotes crassus TaxID=5936 RepID=A0AAD1XP34_EUPCR|nr:unnamed protein product [Moneuplotes crassus]